MLADIFLFLVVLSTYHLLMAKRISALIRGFRVQSLCLFLAALISGINGRSLELDIVAVLIFVFKVALIPYCLGRMAGDIRVDENVGFFINPLLSLVCGVVLTYASYLFSVRLLFLGGAQSLAFTASLSVILMGLFIMIFRMKALSQAIGFLVMENGLFLTAASLSGGMPFLVEIFIFMDVFVSVIIFGIFMYRINKLFTHIDVSRLTILKR